MRVGRSGNFRVDQPTVTLVGPGPCTRPTKLRPGLENWPTGFYRTPFISNSSDATVCSLPTSLTLAYNLVWFGLIILIHPRRLRCAMSRLALLGSCGPLSLGLQIPRVPSELPPLDLSSSMKGVQDVRHLSRDQTRRYRPIGVAVYIVLRGSISLYPDVPRRYPHRTSRIWLAGSDDISLQSRDPLDGRLFRV
jgi:hypothetical protein